GLLDARVEALSAFRRSPLPKEHGTAATLPLAGTQPNAACTIAPKLLERNVVELTFVSTPGAARKVINQIAGASREFCIMRVLHVRNEKDKGPPRESGGETSTAPSIPAPSPAAKATPAATLNFIVGNEKI